jgi:N6-adenosine-specific RNA methylase IME4
MLSDKQPFHHNGERVKVDDVCPEDMATWVKECESVLQNLATRKKKYKVVYADPPWCYANKGAIRGKMTYPTMTLSQLKALPVRELADDCSCLFLWTTGPHLDTAMDLIHHWGFKYKTVFKIWEKRYDDELTKPVVGPGWWSRSSTEFVLCATRGVGYIKWKTSNSVRQEHPAKRTKHSNKPSCIRKSILDFFDVDSKIELFARSVVDGVDAWGLEIPGYFHDAKCQSNAQNTTSADT